MASRPASPLFRRAAAAALAAALALHAPAPRADDDEESLDHEQARAALERGEVLPLAQILAAVAPRIDGEIVSTEFEREDGRWVYEIKYIDQAGRLDEILVDAGTGTVIEGGGK